MREICLTTLFFKFILQTQNTETSKDQMSPKMSPILTLNGGVRAEIKTVSTKASKRIAGEDVV